MNRSISIIERRVNELGLTEPVIQRQGRDRIIVELPGRQGPGTGHCHAWQNGYA